MCVRPVFELLCSNDIFPDDKVPTGVLSNQNVFSDHMKNFRPYRMGLDH